MASRNKVLSLYKALMKESLKMPAYNFREYAIRRVHDAFKANKNVSDTEALGQQIIKAEKNLEIIRRQAIIGHLYSIEKLVIEHQMK
ncbi:hypothetical protein JTB14_013917 [Gonioctena quinquepunctata]|nr:hypothetical protein JTB14_013917 [Gonioctena quinquepunctata]